MGAAIDSHCKPCGGDTMQSCGRAWTTFVNAPAAREFLCKRPSLVLYCIFAYLGAEKPRVHSTTLTLYSCPVSLPGISCHRQFLGYIHWTPAMRFLHSLRRGKNPWCIQHEYVLTIYRFIIQK